MKCTSVLALAVASAPLIVATPVYNGVEAAVEQAGSSHVLDARAPGFFNIIRKIPRPRGGPPKVPKPPGGGKGLPGAVLDGAKDGAKDGVKKGLKDAIGGNKKPKGADPFDKFDPPSDIGVEQPGEEQPGEEESGEEQPGEEQPGEEEQEAGGSGSDDDVPGVIPLDG
ncbi:hypothetical protein CDD81_5461 [Ophiocordyceps australis]|uniref:Uncharacterized protein n=1 Tax=Ophiocordyceps australis TaxID=1399860 RepID=A0A2C5YA34_9HYPO|nr:hypothetical protein CDD81_5461 [Ophiocordyceps australis]